MWCENYDFLTLRKTSSYYTFFYLDWSIAVIFKEIQWISKNNFSMPLNHIVVFFNSKTKKLPTKWKESKKLWPVFNTYFLVPPIVWRWGYCWRAAGCAAGSDWVVKIFVRDKNQVFANKCTVGVSKVVCTSSKSVVIILLVQFVAGK